MSHLSLPPIITRTKKGSRNLKNLLQSKVCSTSHVNDFLSFYQLHCPKKFLNPLQKKLIWQNILGPSYAHLWHEAITTWNLCHDYQLPWDSHDFAENDEQEQWQAWALQFQRWLTEHQYLDSETITGWVYDGEIKTTLLSMTPRDQLCFPRASLLPYKEQKTGVKYYQFQSISDECRAIQEWMKEHPNGGCIVSDACAILLALKPARALYAHPMIQSLLHLMSIDEKIEWGVWQSILSSPYFAFPYSKSLLLSLKRQLSSIVPIDILLQHCPKPWQILLNLFRTEHQKKAQYSSFWVDMIFQKLEKISWASHQMFSTEEIAVKEKWIALLQQHASLDFLGLIPFRQFVSYLIHASQNHRSNKSPILYTEEESLEIYVQDLWITEMDAKHPYRRIKNHAFIPLSLQAQMIPHTKMQNAMAIEEQYLHHWTHHFQSTTLSYQQMENGIELRAHPLLPKPEIFDIAPEELYREKIEEVCPIYPGELEASAQLPMDQEQCPFLAFAKHWLKLKELPESKPYLTALEAGQTLHYLLQIEQFDPKAYLEQYYEERGLDPSLLAFQIDRFHHLFQDFQLKEKKRPYFKIFAVEQAYQIHLRNSKLNLRIDRIDRIGDHYVIIDYKLKKTAPEFRQLEIYSLIDLDVRGYLFILFSSKGAKYTGKLASPIREISGAKYLDCSWEIHLKEKKEHISVIVDHFLSGKAPAQPKNTMLCQHCPYHALCRISQITQSV